MIAGPRVLILSSSLDSTPREIVLQRPMTVGEIVAAEDVALNLPTIAVLTDPLGQSKPVMRGQWQLRMVQPGYQLAFVPVPGRGSLTSILAAVAGIALAVVAPWAAGLLANTFFGGSLLAKSLIGGALMIAGQFVINRLLGPQSTPAAESVFSARASSNQARPLEPIPALYGLMRYAPPYAAKPYAEYVDNDQYLYQLHCLTVGHGDPLKWEIGETVVWTKADGFTEAFEGGDTEIEIIRPGDAIKLFPANVVTASTVDGQQVPDAPDWLGPFAVSAPGIEVSRIVCDYILPLGLIHIDKKGRGVAMTRTIKAEYRKINDAGVAQGGWQPLIDFEHRAATRTPQRFSRGVAVPKARYEVRFGASGTDQSDNTGKTSTLNRVLWAGLRGYVEGFVTPPDCTLVATKIRATENLSREAAGQYLWTVQRLLPVWSEGGGWSAPVATRSPAWAVADMLARLDVPDTDYDLGWLKAYSTVWETRGDRFDGVFERRWQASEALDAVLRVGRSYHVRLGWMIGFNRDEPKQVRRMAFTPDNVVRGSIQREDIWFSEDQPDCLKVIYLDGETWREREVMAAIGAVGDDSPEELPAFGITNYDHAWREGIFTAAENAFRRSFRTFQVEREGRMLVRGDPVVLHDPLLDVVVFDDPDSPGRKIDFARLVDRAGDTLTLDRSIVVEPGETYHLALRDRFGREWGPCLVQSIAGNQLVLNAADCQIVEGQHGQLNNVLPDTSRAEPAHVSLLKGDYRLFDGLVIEARPVGPELWDVTIVNDDQRVHAVDQTEPTPAPWTPPPMITPPPEKPTVKGVYGLLQQGTLSLTLEAGWQAAPGADRYIAEISYEDDAAADPAAATWTPVHDSRATRLSIPAMPQPVTLRVAGVGKMQGAWAYATIVDVPELRLPEEVEDPIRQELEQFTRDALIANDKLVKQVHANVRKLTDDARRLAEQVIEQSSKNYKDHKESITRLSSTYDKVTSEYLNQITLATGPGSALGQRVEAIEVKLPTLAEATALNTLTLVVNAHGGSISALSQSLIDLGVVVDGKADANAVLLLSNRVTATEGEIDVLQDAMLAVQATLPNKADASAVLALSNRVTQTEGNISAVSTALLGVQTSVGKISAGGNITFESGSTSSDGYAQVFIRSSANNGVTYEEAAAIFQSRTTGTVRSRIVLKGQQTAIMDSGGNMVALFGDDGVTIQNIRLGTLNFDQLQSNNGKLIMRGYGDFADLRLFT